MPRNEVRRCEAAVLRVRGSASDGGGGGGGRGLTLLASFSYFSIQLHGPDNPKSEGPERV